MTPAAPPTASKRRGRENGDRPSSCRKDSDPRVCWIGGRINERVASFRLTSALNDEDFFGTYKKRKKVSGRYDADGTPPGISDPPEREALSPRAGEA
jgi:hypothetical protein